ncbi:tail fiber protein [Sphingomonas sp. AOB5]|uniref:phage tail protein n=1 Tax=Sphingomonas sp. AOB5 TaxID=3034017 RepID=UPI0023F768FC|nr:tail fiber protein [Sphingomonas sp. AOB5]MDF7776265.1 tail fiber protein [Sphingomonas sp. AOB5]
MSQQFLGEVRLFPYNFAPKTWAYCAGQLLSIAQNTALFSLLGTTYGGNGVNTFALPDLRGRAIKGTAQNGTYVQGQVAGTETVTLLQSQMPMHNHQWFASADGATNPPPTNNFLAAGRSAGNPAGLYAPNANPVALATTTLGITGGSQPHNNMQPYLVLAYCIALQGIFPSRN